MDQTPLHVVSSRNETIVEQLRSGSIDPQAALDQFEVGPAKHIGTVELSDLKVNILDCGLPTLNDYMVFKRGAGELIILGARPGMGKSALAMQIATYVAQKHNVLVFSLEMGLKSLKRRMLAERSGRSLKAIQQGLVDSRHLKASHDDIGKLKLFIDDRGGIDVRTLASSALDLHRRSPLDLVIIDYLQLVHGKSGTRNEEIGDVSAELLKLAKTLNRPVFATAQLSRAVEFRNAQAKVKDFRPMLSDLRESGNIEQDAHTVLFLSRQEKYDGTREGEADLRIAKNRDGETGDEVFKFLGSSVKFLDPRSEDVI